MPPLRTLIGRVDDARFDLFAERMACIRRAAELKRTESLPANVPSRVTQVIDNTRRGTGERSLETELYAAIRRSVVEAAAAEEEKRIGRGEPW